LPAGCLRARHAVFRRLLVPDGAIGRAIPRRQGAPGRVKARLVAASPSTLTRLNIDVYNDTVYVLGVVDDEARAAEITRLASLGEHPVVSWLEVSAAAPAASPRTSLAEGQPHGADEH
jgi:hypothetical protein